MPQSPQNFRVSGLSEWQVGHLLAKLSSPSLAWPQINRGMGGKSNGACLRGFEPPTFGSGVRDVPIFPRNYILKLCLDRFLKLRPCAGIRLPRPR